MEQYALLLLGIAIMLFACVSRPLNNSILTAPLVFLLVGVGAGELGLGVVDIDIDGSGFHLFAEFTLALLLFSDAARTDLRGHLRELMLPLRLLVIALPLVVMAGAGAAWIFWGDTLSIYELLLLAAILAPTDAALGYAVVTSKGAPTRIRETINIEAGLNDGLALPAILFLAALAGTMSVHGGDESHAGVAAPEIVGAEAAGAGASDFFAAIDPDPLVEASYGGGEERTAGEWAQFVLEQVGIGTVAGIVIGLALGALVLYSTRRGWLTEAFESVAAIGATLIALTAPPLVGGNAFVAAFIAGLFFGLVARAPKHTLDFADAEGQLFTLLTFFFVGAAWIPRAFENFSWDYVLYGALSLTVVRIIPVLIALAFTNVRPKSKWFIAWFGPRGLASVLFLMIAMDVAHFPGEEIIEAAVLITVLMSAIAHGMSAAPLTRAYSHTADAFYDRR